MLDTGITSRKPDWLARAGLEEAVERSEFVAEGMMEVGPSERFFVFLDGDYLGKALVDHFGLPEERGYTALGRVRVTVERLRQEESPGDEPGPG